MDKAYFIVSSVINLKKTLVFMLLFCKKKCSRENEEDMKIQTKIDT